MVWLHRTVQQKGYHAASRTQKPCMRLVKKRSNRQDEPESTSSLWTSSPPPRQRLQICNICSSDLCTEIELKLVRRKHFISLHKELFWDLEMPVTAMMSDIALKKMLLHLTYESLHFTPGKHRGCHCKQKQPLPMSASEGWDGRLPWYPQWPEYSWLLLQCPSFHGQAFSREQQKFMSPLHTERTANSRQHR